MKFRKKIQIPSGLVLLRGGQIGRESLGSISVTVRKAPPLRFNPGSFIFVDGQLWEVVYAYRLVSLPTEWIYCLEDRYDFQAIKNGDRVGNIMNAMGAGSTTPRVVYDLFHSDIDVRTFFSDIPIFGGSRVHYSNRTLMGKRAEIRSSGEILDPVR